MPSLSKSQKEIMRSREIAAFNNLNYVVYGGITQEINSKRSWNSTSAELDMWKLIDETTPKIPSYHVSEPHNRYVNILGSQIFPCVWLTDNQQHILYRNSGDTREWFNWTRFYQFKRL